MSKMARPTMRWWYGVPAVLVGAMGVAAVLIAQPSDHTHLNSREQNREIANQAFTARDPTKCDQIRGSSYYFGPTDAPITMSESDARKQCRTDIATGVNSHGYGG